MTSGIELYINGIRADIEEDALILMNYSSEDLQDPTIVKNSYSQSVTLPGTPQNEKIFGMFFKPIRQSILGLGFTPIKKEPFIIFAKTGEVLEQGYMKLDEVLYDGKIHSYKVTLFGGMGDFLYNLMYRDNGEKKTLADLAYIDGSDNELNFTISAQTVRTAWATLRGVSLPIYRIINFAPCNNGLPENFDTNKVATSTPTELLFRETATDGEGNQFTPTRVIAEYEQDFSEWEMRELRCYLQRPVISLKAIIDAICNISNNGGYTVNLDETFFNDSNPYYTKAWMTLPMLTEIDITSTSQEDGSGSMDFSLGNLALQSETIWSTESSPGVMQGVLSVEIRGRANTMRDLELCYPPSEGSLNKSQSLLSFCFAGYDSDNALVAVSACYVLEPEKVVGSPAYIPIEDQTIEGYYTGRGYNVAGVTRLQGEFKYQIQGDDTHQWSKEIEVGFTEWVNIASIRVISVSEIRTSIFERALWGYQAIEYPFSRLTLGVDFVMDKVVERVTNGVTFTKGDILADTMSPADFLLSFIKTFNLKLFCDNRSKVIDIVTDENYLNGEYIDLEGRVDEQSKNTLPLVCDTSRLVFSSEQVESAVAEKYTLRYRKQFGDFLVYTGYEFNDEEKSLMDSVQFRSTIEATAKGDFFKQEQWMSLGLAPVIVSPYLPAAMFSEATAQGFDGTHEAEVARYSKTKVGSRNYNYAEGYDSYALAQFCDKERKGVDGSGVILFFAGTKAPEAKYALTDDDPIALTFNGNVPCWQYQEDSFETYFPLFCRHLGGSNVSTLWDWGLPKEFYDIDVRGYSEDAAIYNKYWRNFIAEQYGAEARQLKVKVDFEGIQVGQQILRRPVFYDGCWWYISNISNHALAKGELTEVTLVKLVNFQYNELTEE